MHSIFSALASSALALLLAVDAGAATTSGTIAATDPANRSITVRSGDGGEYRFTSNDATQIERDGTKVALGDLANGVHVIVTTEQAPSVAGSALLASRIQVDAAIADGAPGARSEVTVESAGPDGGQLQRTVQVQSGDY